MRIRGSLIVSLTIAALIPPHVGAQTFYANLRGRVVDESGLPVAAAVELFDERTGLSRTTTPNDGGEYVFADVEPGTYVFRAAAPGFKAFERRDLRLAAREFLRIDVELAVGPIIEIVSVNAPAAVGESVSPSVGFLIDRTMIERLPSAGRNV